LDARGFLLAGEFMREGYPIVLARKPGKLPAEELSVEYKKEYGSDQLCISKNAIKFGAKVIVIDDLVATGGSLKAAEELVTKAGGYVVAFLAPYVIENKGVLLSDLGFRLRFLTTQNEAITTNVAPLIVPGPRFMKYPGKRFIVPPSLDTLLPMDFHKVNVKWGRFRYSSDIWFHGQDVKDKEVYVFLDPSNVSETMDVLQLLSILYRKDTKKVAVVIPFLEQSTQDRVEHSGDMESVAAIDTLGKLIGQHTIYTFDLHAEQSRFAPYDLRFGSLVETLWIEYHAENPEVIPVFPDDGAAKRFGKMPGILSPVVFRKKREGEKRIVVTDDEIKKYGHYVIIDDLVRSGGTVKEVAQHILNHGGVAVDALFAHAPLEPKACQNLTVLNDVWCSDSCPRLVPPKWVKLNVIEGLVRML
jgi:adenine/guanine phosphoribosyltransferase-like PRPP-binding protein